MKVETLKYFVCEGCGVIAQSKKLPFAWIECGESLKHPGKFADWCPNCVSDGKEKQHKSSPQRVAKVEVLKENSGRKIVRELLEGYLSQHAEENGCDAEPCLKCIRARRFLAGAA